MKRYREIIFPKLTTYQTEVNDWLGDSYKSGKIAVLKSVRQSGKTFFAILTLLRMALEHSGSVSCIYEPTLNLSRNVFRNMVKLMNGSGIITSANAQTLEIETVNQSRIYFRSTEQTSRGLTVTGILILDECAYLKDEEIFAILPLVNANNAPILIASTPFTQTGYYYSMYLEGLKDNAKVKTFDWSKSPDINLFLKPEQKELYRKTMTRQMYRTEVEGEFLIDEGMLFTNLQNCINNKTTDSKYLYIGIDFATGSDNDYTVLSVFNEKGEQMMLERTNNITPMQQVEWLSRKIQMLEREYTVRKIYAEKNSIGAVYIDALQTQIKTRITDWITTNQSKQELVTTFQIALENQEVKLLNDLIMLDELRKYTGTVNPTTKKISYNGAKGSHDDTVIATMLAFYAYKQNTQGSFKITIGKKRYV